jgi:uncharacterized membrane protein YkvA (DUF1232 family)
MKSDEIHSATRTDLTIKGNTPDSNSKTRRGSISSFWKWLILILAVLYIISPIDILPDPVPLAGWIDDIVVGLTAVSIALQKIMKR